MVCRELPLTSAKVPSTVPRLAPDRLHSLVLPYERVHPLRAALHGVLDSDLPVTSDGPQGLWHESVPMFTHRLWNDDAWLNKARINLYEAKEPKVLESIW